jgi:hypothetical protein
VAAGPGVELVAVVYPEASRLAEPTPGYAVLDLEFVEREATLQALRAASRPRPLPQTT